jgi:hypothetical protein
VFKKFFGKKNDGFYLQIEDDNAAPKSEAKAKAQAKPESAATPTAPVAVSKEAISVAPATPADKKTAKVDKKSAKKAEAPKVVAAPASVVASAPAAPAITNFATDYLIKPSSSSSRRLPGANMSGFLELARQVKKPVNIK